MDTRAEFYGARPREVRTGPNTLWLVPAGDSVTVRSADGESDAPATVVEGFASVTDTPYEVEDWLGTYVETIGRGAFAKTLSESADVRWLVNHDGIPLARTASGTLELLEVTDPADDPQGRGQTGLWTRATFDDASPLAQTVRSAIDRGDMSQMSFAFQVVRQEWDADYTERTIREVRLFDVSGVTYPASAVTSVAVEHSEDLDAEERQDPLDALEEADPALEALERNRRRARAFRARHGLG